MRLVYVERALDDLRRIFDQIAKDDKNAADHLLSRIFDKLDLLIEPELTDMGRPGTEQGTRELIEYPYIIVYEVDEPRAEVIVLSIVHRAQDRF